MTSPGNEVIKITSYFVEFAHDIVLDQYCLFNQRETLNCLSAIKMVTFPNHHDSFNLIKNRQNIDTSTVT